MKRSYKLFALALMLLLLLAAWAVAEAPTAGTEVTGTEVTGTEVTGTETTGSGTTETPAAVPPAPTAVALDHTGTVKLPLGDALTLTPVLTPADAQTTYTWKSSKKSVATVSGGVVKGKKTGTATITVTTANKKKASVKIRVYDPYLPSGVKLDHTGTVKLPLGEQLTLTAALSPETARSKLKWASSSKRIASVSGGVVKAKKVGTATITVTTRNKKKARVKIKVYDPYKPTSVALDKSGTQTVFAGNGLQLTATMKPDTARSTLKWKSSNKKVAVVNQNGFVGAQAPGTATITVTTRNNKKAKVKVKVYDPYLPTSVKLDKTGTIKVPINTTLTLTPTMSPSTAQSKLTWKSSKNKVATVKNGVITAKKTGTTTIMVTTRNKKKAKVKVKVYDPYLPSSIKLDKTGTITTTLGKPVNLAATMSPSTAQSKLTWKTSKKKVVAISPSGVATPLNTGTSTITVTTRNNKKATVKVKVVETNNEPIITPSGYSSPYVIYVCKKTHTVAILARDGSGAWNRVIRKYPTGLGVNNSTVTGTFTLTSKERWHSWGGGYSPYCNKLSCGIFLHGPIYSAKNFNTIKVSYYNHIGTDTSSGCVRTICACAAWVYYNCPVGTQIIIRDNSRFSEPKQAKLSSKATSDPTDPGANPEIPITSFKASPASITVQQGKTQAISLTNIEPVSNSTNNQFTFTSANPGIATVSASGVVTGVVPGSTSITIVGKDVFKATVRVPVIVTTASLAADEAVSTAKLEEDEAAEGISVEETPVVEEVPTEVIPAEEATAEEAATAETAETEAEAIDEAEAPQAAEEAESTVEAEPTAEAEEATVPEAEELIAGTDAQPEPEEIPEEEDNGLIIETEELAEEQTEIIIEEE